MINEDNEKEEDDGLKIFDFKSFVNKMLFAFLAGLILQNIADTTLIDDVSIKIVLSSFISIAWWELRKKL